MDGKEKEEAKMTKQDNGCFTAEEFDEMLQYSIKLGDKLFESTLLSMGDQIENERAIEQQGPNLAYAAHLISLKMYDFYLDISEQSKVRFDRKEDYVRFIRMVDKMRHMGKRKPFRGVN